MFDKALEKTSLLRDKDRLIQDCQREEKFLQHQRYSAFASPFEYPGTLEDFQSDEKNRYNRHAQKKPCALSNKVANRLTLIVAKGTQELDLKIQFPFSLALKIAQDIVLMSQHEPCGFNGCQVNICLQMGRGTPFSVGIIPQRKGFVCTFHLDLELRLKKSKMASIACLCLSRKVTRSVHERNYVLSKRKLYVSQETENFV